MACLEPGKKERIKFMAKKSYMFIRTHPSLTGHLLVGYGFWIPARNSSICCMQTVAYTHVQPSEHLAMRWLPHRRVFYRVPVDLCSKTEYSCKQCSGSILGPLPAADQR